MGKKKLIVFNSVGGPDYHLHALVNSNTEDLVISELTAAAISDANLHCNRNTTPDSDSVTGTIKRLLEPLGFEFIDQEAVVQTVDWDNYEQKASLLAIRILHEGYTSEENEDGTLHICTDKGMFKVRSICNDADVGWEYFPNEVGYSNLIESGFHQLITLLNNEHTQSSQVHWR